MQIEFKILKNLKKVQAITHVKNLIFFWLNWFQGHLTFMNITP
jgi:hypothetical protein